MTADQDYKGVLKPTYAVSGPAQKNLSTERATLIGRDPGCQIVIDTNNPKHRGVSGRHAEIRPLLVGKSSIPTWEICDLNSTNGTYVNRQRLIGCQTLQSGDRIQLDLDGPTFLFELHTLEGIVQIKPPPNNKKMGNSIHLSHVLPALTESKDLFKKAYLIPGIATVMLVISLFSFKNFELSCSNSLLNPLGLQTSCYNLALGTYLALAAMYVTYILCGKYKPWWILISSTLFTIIFLITPLSQPFFYLFRGILPGGNIPEGSGFFRSFIGMFFRAGLCEELIKVLPVFAALYLGQRLQAPWRLKVGIWEPLDGILLGVASALGFTYIETLGQYVNLPLNSLLIENGICKIVEGSLECQKEIPKIIQIAGGYQGLMLIIPRIISAVSGHAAWSGYLGYFIGLGVLRPNKRWLLIGIGYLSSSTVHALWNSVDQLTSNQQFATISQTLIGVLSYVFLMAAILKARQLSPNRAQNFATRVVGIDHKG